MTLKEANALWDRVGNDYRRDWWQGAMKVLLAPKSPLVLTYYQVSYYSTTPGTIPADLTLFGLPVQIDPTLPSGELRLEGAEGALVRLVNIGERL